MKGWLLGLGVAATVQACGTGTEFGAALVTSVGMSPGRPAIADFNGDGLPDIVVGRGAAPFGIDVMLNTGNGSFAAAVGSPLARAEGSFAAVSGDFNKDGKADFVISTGSGKVTLYLGNGAGGFTVSPASPIAFGGAAATGRLVAADLNNDAKLDIVGIIPSTAQIAVLLGDGAGGFAAATTYSTGASTVPSDIAVLQSSADTFLDVAVSNTGTNNVALFVNKGDGTFNAATNQAAGFATYGIAAGDTNKDSKDDAVVTDGVKNYTWLKGAANGTLAAQATAVNDNAPTNQQALTIGDTDHDGKVDVITVDNQATGAAHVSKGDGAGGLPSPTGYSLGGANPISADFIDMNNDGAPDIVSVLAPAGTTGALSVLPNSRASKITMTASPASPAPYGGMANVVNAIVQTVYGNIPTGNVVFKEGANVLGTSPINASGAAQLSTKTFTQGIHKIVAEYAGDSGSFPGKSAEFSYEVRGATTTVLTSSVNPSVNGQSIDLVATVNVTGGATGTPVGSVKFADNGVELQTVALDGAGMAKLTTSALTVGSHPIVATFLGGTGFALSTSNTVTQVVNKADTTIALTSSANPSAKGSPVTFTATPTVKAPGGGTITGTITFMDGASPLGTASITGGASTISVASLAVGAHNITAVYTGTASLNGTTSEILVQNVALNAATVMLTSSKNPSSLGESVSFTAKVTGSGATPTGQVQFLDDTTALTTVNLSAGQAIFQTSTLTGGIHTINVKYLGDINNGVANGTLMQTVNRISTSTALTASKTQIAEGEAVALTVKVTPNAATGSVTFKDGDAELTKVDLTGGSVTYNAATLGLGSHSITAVYEGDTTYDTSTSTPVAINVGSDSSASDAGVGTTPDDAGSVADSGKSPSVADAGDEGSTTSDSSCGCVTTRRVPLPVGLSMASFGLFALAVVRRRAKK